VSPIRLAAALAAFAVAILLACEPRTATPVASAPAERWWVDACGDVQPLAVMGHDIAPPKLVHRVDPQFRLPPATRGSIIIETVLTDRGEVCAARILRGLTPDMNDQALAAVKQWRFTPVTLNGQPRPAFFNLTVSVR
jgi:TonB family protein